MIKWCGEDEREIKGNVKKKKKEKKIQTLKFSKTIFRNTKRGRFPVGAVSSSELIFQRQIEKKRKEKKRKRKREREDERETKRFKFFCRYFELFFENFIFF